MKSAGGDYSSLSAWEAGQQGDLTSGDTIQQAECYSFQDTTNVLIDGWTTSPTQYIRIYTPSTERHDGKWNTSKYYLSVSGSANVVQLDEEYARIEGIQVENTDANSQSCILTFSNNTSDIRIDSCICRKGGKSGSGLIQVYDSTALITNCITYGAQQTSGIGIRAAKLVNPSGATVTVDNCTVANCVNYGIQNTGSSLTLTNCYSGGNTTDDYDGTITRTTCAHSSATSFTGSTASVAYSTANFVNVTSGSEDLHLTSGSALKNAGTDLSATFTTDIDGQTRPTGAGTWDIGADEIVAAASAVPLLMLLGVG